MRRSPPIGGRKSAPQRLEQEQRRLDVDLLQGWVVQLRPFQHRCCLVPAPQGDEVRSGMEEYADAKSSRQAVPDGIDPPPSGRPSEASAYCARISRSSPDATMPGRAPSHRQRRRQCRERDRMPPCRPRHRRSTSACIPATSRPALDSPLADRIGDADSLLADDRQLLPAVQVEQTLGQAREHLGSCGRWRLGRYQADRLSICGEGDPVSCTGGSRRIRPAVHRGDRPWSRRSFRRAARSPSGCSATEREGDRPSAASAA